MKRFDQLDDLDQCALLAETLRLISEACAANPKVRTLRAMADSQDRPVQELWEEVCESQDVEKCRVPDRILGNDDAR